MVSRTIHEVRMHWCGVYTSDGGFWCNGSASETHLCLRNSPTSEQGRVPYRLPRVISIKIIEEMIIKMMKIEDTLKLNGI